MLVFHLLRALQFPPSASSAASWELAATLCSYSRLYGAQLVLVALLSAMTVYRREMSCNHVYNGDDETENQKSSGGADDARRKSQTKRLDVSTEELLEGAGNFCSGEPLLIFALSIFAYLFWPVDESPGCKPLTHDGALPPDSSSASTSTPDLVTEGLPPDVQVHVLSFLHPKDVTSFACANRACHRIVEKGDTSTALWRTLWYRDYAWLLLLWDVGRQALQRSLEASRRTLEANRFDKHFYFSFGQSYINYTLAGQNTPDRCLVGLHGHIYDLTPFLRIHPGSEDTLMVHSGRDATRDFEQMTHSLGARRMARSLCVALNAYGSDAQLCGVHPTTHTPTTASDHLQLPTTLPTPDIAKKRRIIDAHLAHNLRRVRFEFATQEESAKRRFTDKLASEDVLSHVHVYYDPICREWKAWYTTTQFETVFVSD